MIVMDFFTDRMPGMLDRLTISIIHQKVGKKVQSILAEEAAEMWQEHGVKPFFKFESLPPEIILPGLLSDSFSQLI